MTSLLMSAIWHHRSTRGYRFRRSLRYRIKGQDGWCHASLEDKQSITIDRPNFSQTVPTEEKLRIIVNMKPSSLIRNPPLIPTQTSCRANSDWWDRSDWDRWWSDHSYTAVNPVTLSLAMQRWHATCRNFFMWENIGQCGLILTMVTIENMLVAK